MKLSRRQWLAASPSVVLAAGCWPGVLAAGDPETKDFAFLVVNDLHSLDKKCGPWFETVVKSMAGHKQQPEFLAICGDLAEDGTPEQLATTKDIFTTLKRPMYATPGNHDYSKEQSLKTFNDLFPKQLHYTFDLHGWQFLVLDTTEGTKYDKTKIGEPTLKYMDEQLPKLDKKKPLVVFTHFPLGEGVRMRPTNADDVLKRLLPFNLKAVYSGHYHSFTEKKVGTSVLTTNRCCALSRNNHDGTKEKGYFLVQAKNGQLERTFVELKLPK